MIKTIQCQDERNEKKKCFKCGSKGTCTLLDNTFFLKSCPFYKTVDQAEADRKRWE